MSKINIIAICGKSASGKDTILKKVSEAADCKPIVSCTTRPKREEEVDDVDYHFLTLDEFTKRTMSGDMLEATIFNNWCYGTSLKELDPDKVNIGVFNPEGIEILLEDPRVHLTIYYISTSDKIRLMRALMREKSPNVKEIIRRYATDEKDFSNFESFLFRYGIVLKNETRENLIENVRTIVDKINSLNCSEN